MLTYVYLGAFCASLSYKEDNKSYVFKLSFVFGFMLLRMLKKGFYRKIRVLYVIFINTCSYYFLPILFLSTFLTPFKVHGEWVIYESHGSQSCK